MTERVRPHWKEKNRKAKKCPGRISHLPTLEDKFLSELVKT